MVVDVLWGFLSVDCGMGSQSVSRFRLTNGRHISDKRTLISSALCFVVVYLLRTIKRLVRRRLAIRSTTHNAAASSA